MEWLRTLAPFVLAMLLLKDKTGHRAGKDWFLKTAAVDLESLGAPDPDKYASTFWENAQVAGRPGSLYGRILAVSLGIYLLLPERYLDEAALGLFAIAVASHWLVGFAASPEKENAGTLGFSRSGVVTWALVILAAACAGAKLYF